MRDIWNPWHGCKKVSEGCRNCYMFFLDALRNQDGSVIRRTGDQSFRYPLSKDRQGNYRVKPGQSLRVCLTSDFFLKEADAWRPEAWQIIRSRPDVIFYLLTKRPERISEVLPADWGEGWENVMVSVSCENQKMADKRIPVLLALPARHRGVMCAPLIGPVTMADYLASGKLDQVLCDGENYQNARVCSWAWVRALGEECRKANVTFVFCGTGSLFEKDGRLYHINSGRVRAEQAFKSGVSFQGRKTVFRLTDPLGLPLSPEDLAASEYIAPCEKCSFRVVCHGCGHCERCGRMAAEDNDAHDAAGL